MSRIKIVAVLASLSAPWVMLGAELGGNRGLLGASAVAAGMCGLLCYGGAALVLRVYNARKLAASELPQLRAVVQTLAQRAGIVAPQICIAPSAFPTAFAVGRHRDRSAIVITQGIVNTLSLNELASVLAHEVAHIKHRDVVVSTLMASVVALCTLPLRRIVRCRAAAAGAPIADMHFVEMHWPTRMLALPVAVLLQMALARSREFFADAVAVQLHGNSHDLVSALRKIDSVSALYPMPTALVASHMFFVSPLRGWIRTLFNTHPSVQRRIAQLTDRTAADRPLPGLR